MENNPPIDTSCRPPNFPDRHSSNTFSRRASCTQVSAYLVQTLSLIIYLTCIHYLRQDWVLFSLYVASMLAMVICSAVLKYSDPTDRIIYHYKWAKLHPKAVAFDTNNEEYMFCWDCDAYCSIRSRHCRICNRCVRDYDHHCIWVNNCVNKGNYRIFIALIFSVLSSLILFTTAAILMLTNLSNINQYLRWAIPTAISLIILIPFGLMLLVLVLFHLYLIFRGLTTYEFLQERRKMKIIQQKQQEEEKTSKQQNQESKQSAQKIEAKVHNQNSSHHIKVLNKITNNACHIEGDEISEEKAKMKTKMNTESSSYQLKFGDKLKKTEFEEAIDEKRGSLQIEDDDSNNRTAVKVIRDRYEREILDFEEVKCENSKQIEGSLMANSRSFPILKAKDRLEKVQNFPNDKNDKNTYQGEKLIENHDKSKRNQMREGQVEEN